MSGNEKKTARFRPRTEDNAIDPVRVVRNFWEKRKVFAWVLVLCVVIGLCAPLAVYPFTKEPQEVSAVATVEYAETLAAPDGSPLDLTKVTSAAVLQEALDGVSLSRKIAPDALSGQVEILPVLSEASRKEQDMLAGLAKVMDPDAYTPLKDLELTYENRFTVTLKNTFGLKDEETRLLLDRILDAYNDFLARGAGTSEVMISHTSAQGSTPGILAANGKKMALCGALGLILGCVIWIIAALWPEMLRSKGIPAEETAAKEGAAK